MVKIKKDDRLKQIKREGDEKPEVYGIVNEGKYSGFAAVLFGAVRLSACLLQPPAAAPQARTRRGRGERTTEPLQLRPIPIQS
jgi:hypothetical protein